jgi:nucleolin
MQRVDAATQRTIKTPLTSPHSRKPTRVFQHDTSAPLHHTPDPHIAAHTLNLPVCPSLSPSVPLSLSDAASSTFSSTSSASAAPPVAAASGSRIFVGNLPFKVTDDLMLSAFSVCGELSGLHYVTDKTTGKFYGSAFIDFAAPDAAQRALALNGTEILSRPIKVGYATGVHAGGANRYNSKQRNGGHLAAAPVSEKPEGTTTVFLGNLSFDIDETTVRDVFDGCGAIAAVRWVEKDGMFKGCGFVEFENTEATDAAVKLNGKEVMGRPIRVDYSGNTNR